MDTEASQKHQALSSAQSSTTTRHKTLACAPCSQRKIKCDRRQPCGNCTKNRIQCTPSVTNPTQRRRRFPERELLDRLRRYETLLRQNNIDIEPLHADKPSLDSQLARYTEDDEGGSQYDDTEQEYSSVYERNVVGALDEIDHGFDDTLLLLAPGGDSDLSSLYPQQMDVFKLWQVYVERIDPILKVTHSPTLQASIIANAGDAQCTSSARSALLFGVYCTAVFSLTEQECLTSFAAPRIDLLRRYQAGCRRALLHCKFLSTTDRECLTALLLYLISIKPDVDRRSLSSLLGTVTRIAQGMGIHSEAKNSKHSVFEAEMRRRLWWAIVLFDDRVCEGTENHSFSSLLPTWDCSPPSNYNDFELRSDMTVLPVAHETLSEALYVVVRNQYADFLRRSEFHIALINPALRKLAQPDSQNPKARNTGDLDDIEQQINTKYMRFCAMDSPLHFLTVWTMRSHLAKGRLLRHYWKHGRPSAQQQTEAQRDQGTSHALAIIECESQLASSPLTKPFRWHISHFPFRPYVHVVQDLHKRPFQSASGRAWRLMSEDFRVRFAHVAVGAHPVFRLFAETVVQAWDARGQVPSADGGGEEVPWIVGEMRRILQPFSQALEDLDVFDYGGLDTNFDFDFDQFLPNFDVGSWNEYDLNAI